MEIYEDGKQIGTLELEENGLYALISCQCEPSRAVRRVYIAYPYGCKYLGIPNGQGFFQTRIAKKQLPNQFCVVSSTAEKSRWLPWRGEIDGILIETALISENEIAMPLHEAMKFPEWDLEETEVNATKMALLPLLDGVPMLREREATKNETLDFDVYDDRDFAHLPADDSFGEDGWQAGRVDL